MARFPARLLAALTLTLASLPWASLAHAQTPSGPDFDLPGPCHFYSQANGGAGAGMGFTICDDASAKMWGEFQRLGGVTALGYPISNRFTWDGFTVQATQKEILQWRPESNQVAFVNIYDKLHDLKQDDWLKAFRSIPPPADTSGDAGKTFDQIKAAKQAWLDGSQPIKAKYFSASDPLQINGLPVAPISDAGPFLIIRDQRNAIQLWKVDAPASGAKAGDVSVTNGGDDAKAAGILPDKAALTPSAPGGAAGAAAPGAPATSTGAMKTSGMRYTFAVHAYNGQAGPVVNASRQAGFGWIKQQVEWARMQGGRGGGIGYGELDGIVNTAAGAGLKVMLSVAKGPGWARADGKSGPPDNPGDFGAFMNTLAAHYAGKVQAYECWNEENLAVEVGAGNIDPAKFVPLLKACYNGIRAGDPNAIVVSGAPTPTGVNDPAIAMDDATYIQNMYNYNGGEVKNYFDALGAHPEAYGNSPDETVENHTKASFANHPSFFFARVKQYHDIMVAAGDGNKQIFATEFGYPTGSVVAGYEYAAGISEQNQADWLVRAFQKANTDYAPWMGMIAVWNLNFQAHVGRGDEKWPWGVLTGSWTPRPAYTALQTMPKANPQ